MFLQLQQQSLLLGHRPNGFTEHYYTEWDDGLGKDKIALFLLISVSNTQIPSAEIAKEAFQLLQDHFLDDLSGDPYDRFENALREINHMAMEKEKELEIKFLHNLHVVVGVIQRDLLFLSQRGEAQGYLLRKRHMSSITEGLFDEKNKEDLFQNIASGVLEVGDNLLFVTGPLIQYVTPNELAKIFSEQSLDQATKELDDLLKGDIEEQLALLAFEVLEKTEDVKVPLVRVEEQEEETEMENEKQKQMFMEENRPLSPRRAQLKRATERLRGFVSNSERFAFLGTIRRWPKKKLLTAIGVVALVTVVGVYGLYITLSEQRKIKAVQAHLDEAQADVAQAQTKGAFDKSEAAVLLDTAQELAVDALNSGYLGSQASDTLKQIETVRDDLDTVHHFDSKAATVLGDIQSKLAPGESLLGVQLVDDTVVAYSADHAFRILTDQVQNPDVLASEDKVVVAKSFPDFNTILMLTSGSKLVQYTDGHAQFADTADVTWHTGVDVATYSNKVYFLDSAAKQIWKYSRSNDSYSGAQGYFATLPDELSTAVSLAVDGKVWVLLKNGTLLQYFAGDPVKYTIKKPPLTQMKDPVRVFTDLEMTQLYVLDGEGTRVFVYDKSSKTDDLSYSSQYAFDDLDEPLTGMAVDSQKNILYVSTASRVYKVDFSNS